MSSVKRAKVTFIIIIAALTFGVVAITTWVMVDQYQRIQHLQSRVTDQNETITGLTDDLIASQQNAQQLYDQLLALPGVEPDGDNPERIPTTVPGEPGATGPRGESGRPPSANEILGAVGEYCATSNACQGVPGTPGVAGPAGAPGAAGETIIGPPGAQGDPGATGPQGDPGPAGPAGPSCPDGFTQQMVYASADPLLYTPTPALACVPVPIEGEAP